MNAVAGLLDLPAPAVTAAQGELADVLGRVLEPEVQLAIWHRHRLPLIGQLATIDLCEVDDIDATITGPDYGPAIASLLADAGYPQDETAAALMCEASRLATLFSALMSCSALRFRLDVVETDGCRKFHMDYVTARLLMPLVGPGTQWRDVAEGAEAPVHQLECGTVGIFKGRIWAPEPTILHRSPPIAASGVTRLLLVLDPHDDVDRYRLAVERSQARSLASTKAAS